MNGSRPNVLFIMCDQLRHDWLGYAGAAHADTPHIDALAARSKVFTQAACNSPVCAPSRIGLASGLRPHRTGALNNHAFLPLSKEPYYARLRNHGYHVGCCGKLDLAKPDSYNGMDGARPLAFAWGFTHPHECEGKMHAGRGDPPNGPYTAWLRKQDPELHRRFCEDYTRRAGGWNKILEPSVLPSEFFEDVYIGQKSCEMIRDMPADFPWHFFVSFAGPHDPFDPPVDYYDRFKDADMPEAIPYDETGRENALYPKTGEHSTPAEILKARRLYTAYMKCIDDQIGAILDTLEATGRGDDTYIVFSADHGEMLGDHGRWTKSVPYEASLRVPLTIAGPGIDPGVSGALVELNDLNPTICDLAGVPPVEGIDARSLKPLLEGNAVEHRDCTIASHLGFGVARTREWKAVIGDRGRHELYHLAEDPDERRNVVGHFPEKFEELALTYRDGWMGSPLY